MNFVIFPHESDETISMQMAKMCFSLHRFMQKMMIFEKYLASVYINRYNL